MNDEIMVNEEVIEAVEELVPAKAGIGGKVLVAAGLTALVCGVAYKFAIKPLVAKRKAKKEERVESTCVLLDDEDVDGVNED